jgi:hypothetical protein
MGHDHAASGDIRRPVFRVTDQMKNGGREVTAMLRPNGRSIAGEEASLSVTW